VLFVRTPFLGVRSRLIWWMLDSTWARAAELELCVAVVAVVRFGCEPTIEVVTIAKKKSARFVGSFEHAVAYVSFGKIPCPGC
jgi:hypothetical protein